MTRLTDAVGTRTETDRHRHLVEMSMDQSGPSEMAVQTNEMMSKTDNRLTIKTTFRRNMIGAKSCTVNDRNTH